MASRLHHDMPKSTRLYAMKTTRSLSFLCLAVSSLSIAQTTQSGGWRRAGDEQPPAAVESPQVTAAGQDPSQPVARSDEYGQPLGPAPQPQAPAPYQQNRQQRPLPPPPSEPYGLPAQLTIPGGTFVTVRMNQELSSNHNQPGDVFTGELEQPVVVNGIVLAQRGQNVIGRVVESGKDGRVTRLGLQMTAITLAAGTKLKCG